MPKHKKGDRPLSGSVRKYDMKTHAMFVKNMIEHNRFDASGVEITITMGSMVLALYEQNLELQRQINDLKDRMGQRILRCSVCDCGVEAYPSEENDGSYVGYCIICHEDRVWEDF